MIASSHMIQFKLLVHIQGGLRHVPFGIQINDLNAQQLASWITHFDDCKSEQGLLYVLARPVLYVDGNGNQVFINADEKDFLEFVAYLHQHAHEIKTEIILDLPEPGSLLQKMITGNKKVLSWDDYKNGLLELSLTEINHLFEQQISDDSMQKIREKQSYSFVNVFNGWSPPSPEKEHLYTQLSESGLLNLKRVTRDETMNLLKKGLHILIPSEDSSFILMTFSKLQGSGHNFFCWQEQNDGNYKCQEVKIPVTVGRQLITYYSSDGKTLRDKFDDIVKNDNEHVLPSTPSAEVHVINTEYKSTSKTNESSDLEITKEYQEAPRNAKTTSDGKKSDDANESCFTLGAHTLYYTCDFLKEMIMPYNYSKSTYVKIFSKASIGDNFPDFNNIMLMPKLIPPTLECSVQNIIAKPSFNMYSITITSKGVCGSYDCCFGLKELSSDSEFEFKIPVIVVRHFSSIVDEKSEVNTKQLATSINSEQPAINDQDVDVCHTNEVIYRTSVTVETVDPPVVQQEEEKTNDHDKIVESKNEAVFESDSDSSISVSIEELNITDETSDAFEVIDLPSCFVSTSTAEDGMQENVKVRVKRRKVGLKSEDKLKCAVETKDFIAPSVPDLEPLSSTTTTNSSYQQFNPVNHTATCSGVSAEQQPINIVSDKVFEMTSNVFKSVYTLLKNEVDDIQKPIFTESNSIPTNPSQYKDLDKSVCANFLCNDWPQEEACLTSEHPQTSGQSWSATCRAQQNATKSPEKAETPDTVLDTFLLREGLSYEEQTQLDKLNEMGFLNDHHNIFLLKQYPNDMMKVIESLCNYSKSG